VPSSTNSDPQAAAENGARGRQVAALSTPGATALRRRRAVAVSALAALAALAVVVVAAVVVVVGRDKQGWSVDVAGPTDLVADDQTVCGTDLDDRLFCLDGATGEALFTEQLVDRPVPFSIVDRTLLVGDHTGVDGSTLIAYSLEGDRLWEAAVEELSISEPPVTGGVVAINDESGSELVGLDLATGEERWRTALAASADPGSGRLLGQVFADGQSFYASLVPFGASAASAVVAVDPESGTERWRSEIDASDLPAHALARFDDGTAVALVVGRLTRHQRLVVLDTATGRLRWQAPLGDSKATAVHVDGTTVVLVGAELRGYSSDGDELWRGDAPTGLDSEDNLDTRVLLLGRLFVAVDVVYLHSSHLYAIDPRTGVSREVVADPVGDVVMTADHLVLSDACCQSAERIEARPR